MKKILIIILNNISININKLIIYLENLSENNVKILSLNYDNSGRYLNYILSNNLLLGHKQVLQAIFNTLKIDEQFIKFGYRKVIIISALINGEEFSFHHNVLINNDTTFNEYYIEVKD